MDNILEQNNIVDIILNSLSKYGNIPSKGFLCGGAVANLLFKLQWGGDYPINDLDIFIETKNHYTSNTPSRTDSLELTHYGQLRINDKSKNTYSIVSSEMDGMVNIIKVARNRTNNNINYMYILKGFDLNCTQVGVNLENGELLCTEEFKKFLMDKQLKVVNPYTPSHTAIRLFKKLDELNCYCDIDGQMKLLSQPFNNEHIIKAQYSTRKLFGFYFNIKYKKLYEKYQSQIEPYFKLYSFFEHKKYIWNKSNVISSEHPLHWLDPSNSPTPQHLDSWAKLEGKVWALEPVKFDSEDEELKKIFNDGWYTPLMLINVWNMLYGGLKKTLIDKIKLIYKYDKLSLLTMTNQQFYDCDFNYKNCEILNNAIAENFYLALIIDRYDLNLQESYILYQNINKIINKEGRWFDDIIYNILLENGNPLIKPNMTIIKSLFEAEKIKLTKPFINGFDLSGLEIPSDVKIKELVSEYDLASAGKKLGNCINDKGQKYKKKIKDGETKIFVIITKNSMSALELNRVNIISYKKRWLLSSFNKEANQYHEKIAGYLIGYIHKELILSCITDELSKHESMMKEYKSQFDPSDDTATHDNKVYDPFEEEVSITFSVNDTTGLENSVQSQIESVEGILFSDEINRRVTALEQREQNGNGLRVVRRTL